MNTQYRIIVITLAFIWVAVILAVAMVLEGIPQAARVLSILGGGDDNFARRIHRARKEDAVTTPSPETRFLYNPRSKAERGAENGFLATLVELFWRRN